MLTVKDILDRTSIFVGQHPDLATSTMAAAGELVGETRVDVRIGRHRVSVDAPKAFGGGGTAPSPEQHALAALGSSVALAYRVWSEKLDIRIDRLSVDVRADIDSRGLLGLAEEVRPGFTEVRVAVHITGPEPSERYHELARVVDQRSSVLDVFTNQTPVTTAIHVAD